MLMAQYKMRSSSSRDIRALHCPVEDSAHLTLTDMAPCSSSYSSIHHSRIADKDNIKLRKPIVEKMRRDRINSCIEQLKIILEKEFHQQEPNSKLEKADILEMTVSFLRQHLQPGHQGYSHCWRDFLSAGSDAGASVAGLQGPRQQEQQFHQAQRTSSSSPVQSSVNPTVLQGSSSSRGPVWRPW